MAHTSLYYSDSDFRRSDHHEEIHHLLGKDFFSRGNIPLLVLPRNPQMPYPLHTHDFMEMVIVTSGTGVHTSPHGNISIGRGALFVIKGDMIHGYTHLENLCLINILFDLETLAIPFFDLGQSPGFHSLFTIDPLTRFQKVEKSIFTLTEPELDELVLLINHMDEDLNSREVASDFLGITEFMRIIHFVSSAYDKQNEETTAANRHPYRLGEVLSYIESNLTKKITIKQLIDIAGMSESSLLRAFHHITGHSPIKYHQIKRIEKASWYLRHSNYSITELSELMGYNDSNYFSRQFHQIRQQSPSEYRRNFCEHWGFKSMSQGII